MFFHSLKFRSYKPSKSCIHPVSCRKHLHWYMSEGDNCKLASMKRKRLTLTLAESGNKKNILNKVLICLFGVSVKTTYISTILSILFSISLNYLSLFRSSLWLSALRISVTFLDVTECLWHIPQCFATSSLSDSEQESWTRNNGCKRHCGTGRKDSMTIKEGHALCTWSIGTLQHHILHRQLPALPLYCELLSVQHHGQFSTCIRLFHLSYTGLAVSRG